MKNCCTVLNRTEIITLVQVIKTRKVVKKIFKQKFIKNNSALSGTLFSSRNVSMKNINIPVVDRLAIVTFLQHLLQLFDLYIVRLDCVHICILQRNIIVL